MPAHQRVDGRDLLLIRNILLLAALTLASCDSALGIEKLPPDPAAEPAECAACTKTSCGAARASCVEDAGCLAAYRCLLGCALDDIGCRLHCEQTHAAANEARFRALDDCRRLECTDVCYGASGFGRLVDAQCSCIDDVCAPFVRNCVRSGAGREGERIGECERRFACLGDRKQPIDPEDALVCSLSREGGGPEANALRFCWQGAECGTCPIAGGRSTACVGNYQWSRAVPEQVKFNLTVTDQRGRLIENARVRACRAEDCETCARPVTQGVTDGTGVVPLALPTFGGGFQGCFEVRVDWHMPALWYPGRPIIADEAVLTVAVLSSEELDAYASALGTKLDLTRGQVLYATRDCLFSPASDLTISADAGAGSFVAYLNAGTPTRIGPTDATGRGAVVNATAGSVTVIARRGATEHGRMIASVRQGWMTGVFLLPAQGGGG